MAWSRRNFLTSLSRTALVLTLHDVLALAAPPQIGSRTPYNTPPRPAPPGAPSPVAGTPLGRVGKPDDIVPSVVFLASDEDAWITGERIAPAGGLRM